MSGETDRALAVITCPTREEAVGIARLLVEERAAAGVQVIDIGSVYRWNEEVVEAQEVLLLAKTTLGQRDRIEALVTAAHSYEVVPLYMVSMTWGHLPYLAWISEETTPTA